MDFTFSDDDFIGGSVSDTEFTVQMEGKDRKFKLKRSQMTCETLGKIFKLAPLSIILYGSDDTVIVPNSSGVFTGIRIHGVDTNTWTVSGDDLPPTVQTKPQSQSPFSFNSSTAGSYSGFDDFSQATRQPGKRFRGQKKSRLAGTGTHQGDSSVGQSSDTFTKNITISQVQNGELIDVKSTTITLNKSATTKDIKRLLIQESDHFKAVKSECSITLLDCKGLEIENTSATKGKSYWGTNRKVKAVRTAEWIQLKRSKLKLPTFVISASSSSETDFEAQRVPQKVSNDKVAKDRLKRIEDMVECIQKTVLKSQSVSVEVASIFQCKICFETCKPPVVVTKCCNNVAGCGICINQCETERCILCRASADDYPDGLYSEMQPIRGVYQLAGIPNEKL